jgi:hypothetical protein
VLLSGLRGGDEIRQVPGREYRADGQGSRLLLGFREAGFAASAGLREPRDPAELFEQFPILIAARTEPVVGAVGRFPSRQVGHVLETGSFDVIQAKADVLLHPPPVAGNLERELQAPLDAGDVAGARIDVLRQAVYRAVREQAGRAALGRHGEGERCGRGQ